MSLKSSQPSTMNSTYEPSPSIIDPFIFHFLTTTIAPPPPLPMSIFFYDPFLTVPPPPSIKINASLAPSTKSNNTNRHRYTPIQISVLHRIFIQLPYPSLEQRRIIAENLNLDVEQVRIWFSNRRSRQRGTTHQIQSIKPTSKEYVNMKILFDKLNMVI